MQEEEVMKIDVLNKGYVALLAYGKEHMIVYAAGMSRNKMERRIGKILDWVYEGDRGKEHEAEKQSETLSEPQQRLVRNCEYKYHTTPLEFAQIVLEVKCPIFIARQWMRHRTGTFVEKSRRYTTDRPEFYIPDGIDKKFMLESKYETLLSFYEELLQSGMRPEQARMVLPVSLYTKFVWRTDAHNLLNGFLRQRLAKAAQPEMRLYARAVSTLAYTAWPNVWQAAAEKYGWTLDEGGKDEVG